MRKYTTEYLPKNSAMKKYKNLLPHLKVIFSYCEGQGPMESINFVILEKCYRICLRTVNSGECLGKIKRKQVCVGRVFHLECKSDCCGANRKEFDKF